MHPITVAIADADGNRRIRYEHSLQDDLGVVLLTDVASSNEAEFETRRAKPRTNITVAENELARAMRLNPRVLLVDLNLCSDVNFSMLGSLHRQCPATFVVLLVEGSGSISEEAIMQAMEAGARGYLSRETAHHELAKVAQVVGRGEIWAPRKMLGKIMDRVLRHEVLH
ncbi:MAG: DNA-binding response regulator [Gallionellaceae bacterium]|nr:DNA-binding response regulator [Gallionellaceae bacterium]